MLSYRWCIPHLSCGVADRLPTGLVFIALKNSPLLNLLFQRGETLRESFYLGRYHFELYQNLQHMDACRYVVRRGGLQYAFSFLGIDSIIECGTKSNVDFIHFVWRNLEAQYAFRRHAITILPDQDGFTTRLLFSRHYDVPSAGWTFSSGCTICAGVAREQVRPFTGCLAPAEACGCIICTRQPPSLKALAFHTYFTLVRNIEQFKLTRHVTYSQYRAACVSGRVDIERLLPPEFPNVTLIHTFMSCRCRPSHTTSSPRQAWICAATRRFESREEAVAALCTDRNLYWRGVCDKLLFFRVACQFHGEQGYDVQ